jgi:tetratricopeptide (TPR) repeat protein
VNGSDVRALIAALLFGCVLCGASAAQGPDERFDLGLEAYENGRFAEAAAYWEQLARLGVHDPRVEYNLANALFKTGRLGEAVLHWERARRLAPTDPDVRWNLRYARTLLADRVPLESTGGPIRWIEAVQDRLGPGRQAGVVLALWWALALVIAWAGARPRGWTATIGWVLAVLGLSLALAGTSWWTTWNRLSDRDVAVVLAESAEVRAGPGENNAGLVTVHEGLTIRVRQAREGWVQIELPDGLNGWIRRDAVGIV